VEETTIPHVVVDAEAGPETNLARATDFWLNRATPSVWLLGYDARQPFSARNLPAR
jgi:hypothetical protein